MGNNKNMRGKNSNQRNSKQSTRGNKNTNYNPKSRTEEQFRMGEEVTGTNNPSWINLNPELTLGAGKVTWNQNLGRPINVIDLDWPYIERPSANLKIPGIMAIDWVPAMGTSDDPGSIMNTVFNEVYMAIRSKQNGKSSYESADLGQYLIAMDSIYIGLAYCRRAIRLMGEYKIRNEYYPRLIADAMCLDYDASKSRISDAISLYNEILGRISKLPVPNGFKVFERHAVLTDNIFKDSKDSPLYQTYLFTPAFLYKFQDEAATLRTIAWTKHPDAEGFLTTRKRTILEYLAELNDMVSATLGSYWCGVIGADLISAYGNSVYGVNILRDGETLPTIYDAGLQTQIENLFCYNPDYNSFNADVTQAGTDDARTYLVSSCSGLIQGSTAFKFGVSLPLNFHWANVEPLEVNYASMLRVATLNPETSADDVIVPFDIVGSELPLGITIYTDINKQRYTQPDMSSSFMSSDYGDLANAVALQSFDWAPQIAVFASVSSGPPEYIGSLVDFDNFTILTKEQLHKIHRANLFSLWDISTEGLYVIK